MSNNFLKALFSCFFWISGTALASSFDTIYHNKTNHYNLVSVGREGSFIYFKSDDGNFGSKGSYFSSANGNDLLIVSDKSSDSIVYFGFHTTEKEQTAVHWIDKKEKKLFIKNIDDLSQGIKVVPFPNGIN